MTPFDWVALVGAAAWLPQVAGWITRHFTKPVLRVIPSHAPEIGYTSFGPILNLPCAISAERKDAVVERITAMVIHERGQTTEFFWARLNENFSQIRSDQGVAEVSRNQPAIALKVSTLVLTEKQIGMQDRTFEQDSRALITALTDTHDHLKQTEPTQYQQATLKSKEFADLMAFANKRLPWQEGRYTLTLDVRVAGVKDPTTQSFHFSLSAAETSRLRQNLDELDRYVRELIEPPKEGEAAAYRWYWAYPPFEQSSLPVKRS